MPSTSNPDVPIAWSYNPSSWAQRIPLIIVATVGFLIAMYLGLFQLGVIHSVWDPLFKGGSEKVLTSDIAKSIPIPDAVLGALGYLLDIVTAIIGGTRRWKKMPWIVIVFGIAVGPLGFVSILLVILQPIIVHAWCFLCLMTAFISLILISPAMDELLASLQYLHRVKHQKKSVWKAFWGDKTISETVK